LIDSPYKRGKSFVLAAGFYIRNSPEGLRAECLTSSTSILLPQAGALSLIEAFRTPTTSEAAMASAHAHGELPNFIELFDTLLESALIVEHTTESEGSSALEFHDAAIHARSRVTPFADFGMAPSEAHRMRTDGVRTSPLDVPLPAPRPAENPSSGRSFQDVLRQRRTARAWVSDQLSLTALGDLLHSCGSQIMATHAISGEEFETRPYPYAGPVEAASLAVAAGNVEGLPAGLYQYLTPQHSLRPLHRQGPSAARFPPTSVYIGDVAAGKPSTAGQPPAMLMVVVDLDALASKYRGVAYSLALKTTGAVLAVVSMCAEDAGLGSTILGLGGDHVLVDSDGHSEHSWTVLGEIAITPR